MTWIYTDGTNWGIGVNWAGQGGIVGRKIQEGKIIGKDHMERLIGKTNRED